MADKVLKPEVIEEESTALMKSTLGVVSMTRTKKELARTLADQHSSLVLNTTMSTFINVDMRFHVGMQNMGEICSNFLKAGEDLQRKWIIAICEYQGIPPIEFNPRAPRSSLALAMFAKYPEMQQQVKNGKDTKGALRISNYLTSYNDALAATKKAPRKVGGGKQTPEQPNPKPRSASDLFLRLYNGGTLKEKQMLTALAGKLGIEYEDWLPESENEETDESNGAAKA